MSAASDAWTLLRYLQRTARRSALAAIEDARLDEANDETSEGHELREAQDALREAFRADMVAGRAASVGQIAAAPGELVAVPAEAWTHARIDWEGSALSYWPPGYSAQRHQEYLAAHAAHPVPDDDPDGVAEKAREAALRRLAKRHEPKRVSMVSVRVRPWLHLLDVPALLDGLPLAVAFRRFVLDDPETVAALERAGHCAFYAKDERTGGFDHPIDASMCEEVREGRFSSAEAAWPATLAHRDLVVEWLAPMPARIAALAPAARRGKLDWLADLSEWDRAAFRIVREAERVMRDRVERFLEPLRRGDVVATGHHVGHGGTITLAPAIWTRPATRIDFVNGELLLAGPSGPPTREWSGIMLAQHKRPAPLPAASPAAPETPAKSKGGAPSRYDWDGAFARLDRRLAQEGVPETGRQLVDMVVECFQAMRSEVPDERSMRRKLIQRLPHRWAEATAREE